MESIAFDREGTVTPEGGGPVMFRQQGSGPPFLLLHGGSGSWNHWARNVVPLSARFTVVVPDLPGFGDSADVVPKIPLDDYLALVGGAAARWLEQGGLGGEALHLAGFSFGGMIAAGVSAGPLGERLARMTLVAPGGLGPFEGKPLDMRRAEPGMDQAALNGVYRHNLRRLMLSGEAAIDGAAVAYHRANLERARFRNVYLSRMDVTVGYLSRLAAPLQVLYGARDAVAHPGVEARIGLCRKGKPGLTAEIIPDCGHWASYEQADAVNRLLLAFHGQA